MKTANQYMTECLTERDYGQECSARRIKDAMQDFAQQQACEFAEWCSENSWYMIITPDYWQQSNDEDAALKTTAELYEQWKKTNP